MRKIRLGGAALSLLLVLAFAASAQATTNFTSSNVTSPANGSLLFQNMDTNPTATITVSGTTNWTASDASNLIDIDCFSSAGNTVYLGESGAGIAVATDGSFSVSVPQAWFANDSCQLVAVPHGTSPAPGDGYTGPIVGFSEFQTDQTTTGGPTDDYDFDDAASLANTGSYGIDDCGPYSYPLGGTSSVNIGNYLFNCAGSFYTSLSDRIDDRGADLQASEIQVDGQNAYGSYGAASLFTGSDALPGFPALTATLDSFNSANGDAQTTESEPLVKCTPEQVYTPTSSTCTAFASTGVTLARVTDYTNDGRVVTVTDTFTSTDGQAHSLDLEYETDLGESTAGWELPGQSNFSYSTGYIGPAAPTAPGTAYAIDDTTSSPSLSNPVGAVTFSAPYNSVTFDDTIWGSSNPSALFDFTPVVPAGGSTSITWSYATGTSLAEVQGYAANAQDAMRAPAVTISSPAGGATETSSPVTVSGTASAGSGVKSVTVNGVSATVSGGSWSASVPLTLGSNTLTATLTSDAGNTTTATATVAYAPPARVSIKSKRFNGKAVLVKLACAASGSNCAGKVTLRYTETVVKHHKKHRTTVTIASKRYSLRAGRTATVSAGLSGTGRRLLKAHHKLAVKGSVTVTESGGHVKTAKTFTLTLKQPTKHHKK